MSVTQLRRPRTSAALPQTTASRVREMLLEIAYRLHANKVVARTPGRDSRRRPADRGLFVVS